MSGPPDRGSSPDPREVVTIMIVDDHSVFAEAVAESLATDPHFSVVAVAGSGEEALAKAADHRPDVAVLDVSLPDMDGVELAKRLRRQIPDIRLLFLTALASPIVFARAMEAGAFGFLLKETHLAELVAAVRQVAAGQPVVPKRTLERVMLKQPGSAATLELSPRQVEVLELLAHGADAAEIAKALGISWHTVRTHIKQILGRLDARSQLEAVAKALQLGIVEAPGPD